MHPVRCKCGTVRGQLEGTGIHNRLICYCTDCRAFARFLGKAPDVLDEQGGTEILQVAQSRLHIRQGEDRLAAIRLSDKGMVRWYASCCGTPIGNTMDNPKMSFIGLIHSCLDQAQMNEDFGTNVAVVNTDTALGNPKPKQRGLLGVAARFMWIVVTSRISGRYRMSPLFNGAGLPQVEPKILPAEELANLKSAL
ncbi:MAG: hypothetical protein H3C29_10470 [Simplicispira suum]|uniref:DUF6151 family protein n=1 Tax=Simplicispira suum TaxID=2109915 RepID=UPI001C6CE8AE|nr:DUF6151 family protein [Simplicispira suum]MBW7833628.1 hypothetical protein [Simplicispira suum]